MGLVFATVSAMLNGLIGIFNSWGFESGASPAELSFLKCLVAFLLLSGWILPRQGLRRELLGLRRLWKQYAVVSLCGTVLLFYCETSGFSCMPVPNVAFLCLGSAYCVAHILEMILKRRLMTRTLVLSFLLVAMGGYLLAGDLVVDGFNVKGTLYAICGGCGYASFMVLFQRFKLKSTVCSLWWLFGFGTLVQGIMFAADPAWHPVTPQFVAAVSALALLPTLAGFYLTSLALSSTSAEVVQTIEMLEPVFATIFSALLLAHPPSGRDLIGAAIVTTGIAVGIRAAHTRKSDTPIPVQKLAS